MNDACASNRNFFQIFRSVHSQHSVPQRCSFCDSRERKRYRINFPCQCFVSLPGRGYSGQFGNGCIDFPDNRISNNSVTSWLESTQEKSWTNLSERRTSEREDIGADCTLRRILPSLRRIESPIAKFPHPAKLRCRSWQIFSGLVSRSARKIGGHSSKIFTLAIALHRELCYLP